MFLDLRSKQFNMTTVSKSRGKYWIQFVVSLLLTAVFLVVAPAWFWIWLPILCTSFVQGMDWL